MIAYFAWPAAILAGWGAVYLIWIKPLQAKIVAVIPGIVKAPPAPRIVAGMDVLMPPTKWQKFVAKIEGWKTIGLSFVLSFLACASEVLDVAQRAGVIGDLQTIPWASFLKPEAALKIISALSVAIPVFHMLGKLKAATAVPLDGGTDA